ncbi:phosphatase PAP2 family protein [Luteibacter yeojuensis]|uniref:Phosphatase PAP2 family protein n=1 Tax=Luteibacter yeojuensis TaxID=345309 RepID=A0A7X5QSJ4_9GAMM|nr:phosphatase PAP2 family protein [Luteibacter yeojuensis]NID14564.1 phosphatase PAP2 family protein [Luteibacter yeojuensis]
MTIWMAITALGDSAVLLPMMGWMAICLMLPPPCKRDAWGWLLAIAVCGGCVMLSKLLFMAWGIRPPWLDYTGFSGHTALAILVWPTLAALLTREGPIAWRRAAIALASTVGLAVGVSRLALGFHSLSEVWLGGALGALVVSWFLRVLSSPSAVPGEAARWRRIALGGGALAILLLCYGRVFPSQHLLQDMAVWLSGHPGVFTRPGPPG